MIGIRKWSSVSSNYSFFDNDNNQITSEEVNIDDSGILFHNGKYASFKRTQSKHSSYSLSTGLEASFALSYKLTDQFGLRFRNRIGVYNDLKTQGALHLGFRNSTISAFFKF